MFKFEVVGPRKVYRFDMELQGDLTSKSKYQSLQFTMTPYSTYIGLNEEELKLTFLMPDKIISGRNTSLTVANTETSIKIYDSSDAIPKSTDVISTTFGYIVG